MFMSAPAVSATGDPDTRSKVITVAVTLVIVPVIPSFTALFVCDSVSVSPATNALLITPFTSAAPVVIQAAVADVSVHSTPATNANATSVPPLSAICRNKLVFWTKSVFAIILAI